jgi:hypothetical protein
MYHSYQISKIYRPYFKIILILSRQKLKFYQNMTIKKLSEIT